MAHLELEPLRHMGLLERARGRLDHDPGGPSHRYGDFRVERRALVDCAAIEPAWAALAARAVEANIFMEPGFLLPAARHLSDGGDYEAILVWRTHDGAERLAGFWPMRAPNLAIRLGQGFNCRYSCSGAPLLDRDFAVEAASALVASAVAALPSGAGLLFPEIAVDGPAARALRVAAALAAQSTRELDTHLRACLWGHGPETGLGEGRRGRLKTKATLRRLEEFGPVRLTRADSPADLKAAAELFLALEAGGWKGRRGTAILASGRDSAFFRMMLRELSRHGKARVMLLEAGDRIAAAGVVLVSGDQAWFVKTGYDEQLRDAAPGVLLARLIGESLLAEEGVTLSDSCAVAGNAVMERLWRGRIRIGDLIIAPPETIAGVARRETRRRALRALLKRAWYRFNGWPMG